MNLIKKLIYVGNNSIADFLVEPSQCRIKWQIWKIQEHIVVEEFYCTVTKPQPTAIFFEHNAFNRRYAFFYNVHFDVCVLVAGISFKRKRKHKRSQYYYILEHGTAQC